MSNQQLTRQVAAAGSGIGRATGFELAGRDQPNAANIDSALERNRDFAAAGGHEGAVVFPKLRLFVITCLDPRVDPAHFLGLALSDAMVIRNVGGRVTPEVINDVAFIAQMTENVLPDGPLFEVAVIHHTQCRTGALADATFRRCYARRIGADEADLRDRAVLDPAATVTRDVERLRSAGAIPGRVTVSGHVYDVVSGLVQTIPPPTVPQTETRHNPNPPRRTNPANSVGSTRRGLLALTRAGRPAPRGCAHGCGAGGRRMRSSSRRRTRCNGSRLSFSWPTLRTRVEAAL